MKTIVEEVTPVVEDIAALFGLKETIAVPLPKWIKDDVTIEESNLEPMHIIYAYTSLLEEINKRKALLNK